MAPGDYGLEVGGETLLPRLTLVSTVRTSPASIQDEVTPREPQFTPRKPRAEQRAAAAEKHWDGIVRTLKESGVNTVLAMASVDTARQTYLDAARGPACWPWSTPTRGPPASSHAATPPEEVDSMSQRMILTAQANGR